jgi:hypothetical protein
MQTIPESSFGRMGANSVVAIPGDDTTPSAAAASTKLAQNDPELSNAVEKRVTIDTLGPNGSPSHDDLIIAPSPATSSTGEDPPAPACSLEAEMDAPVTTPCVILVPDVGRLREGAQLVNTIQLGRKLGAGMVCLFFCLALAASHSTTWRALETLFCSPHDPFEMHHRCMHPVQGIHKICFLRLDKHIFVCVVCFPSAASSSV